MTMKWMTVLGIVLLTAQAYAGEATALKTPAERTSYGLGVDMGRSLNRQGAEIDPEIVLRGLKDAMKGKQLQMSDEELMSTMKNFAAERRAKQNKDKPAVIAEETIKAEDLDTLYAVGLVLYRQLAPFNLSPAELQLVKQGLLDAGSGRGPEGDLGAYNQKINDLAQRRRKIQGERVAAANKEFLDKAAKQKGAVKTDSGLIYLSLKDGEGTSPKTTDTVKVNYRGTLPDGKEFGSSQQAKEPMELKLGGAIKCWNEGLLKMKPGGKARLVCPPETAYGETGSGELILPYATLVFEVELLEVKQ